jgi:hypothetical protein
MSHQGSLLRDARFSMACSSSTRRRSVLHLLASSSAMQD